MSRVTNKKKMLQSDYIKESPQTIGELHMRAQQLSIWEFIIFPGYVKPNQVVACIGFIFLYNFQNYVRKSISKRLLQKPVLTTSGLFLIDP